jgi:hypothetical protein
MNGNALITIFGFYLLYVIGSGVYSVYDSYNSCDAICSEQQLFLFRKEPQQVSDYAKLLKSLEAERKRYNSKIPKEYRMPVK